MTIMKSMQFGFKGAKWTILGTASGTIIMAGLSATGLSLLLSSSPQAYNVLRLLGACYMIWLGVRNWRAKTISLNRAVSRREKQEEEAGEVERATIRRLPFFLEGIGLQMTNPMLIMFFVSLFPQFIDPQGNYPLQFASLSFTYFALVVVIHSLYSLVVTRFRALLNNARWIKWIYRIGGTIFIALAVSVLRQVFVSWVQ